MPERAAGACPAIAWILWAVLGAERSRLGPEGGPLPGASSSLAAPNVLRIIPHWSLVDPT